MQDLILKTNNNDASYFEITLNENASHYLEFSPLAYGCKGLRVFTDNINFNMELVLLEIIELLLNTELQSIFDIQEIDCLLDSQIQEIEESQQYLRIEDYYISNFWRASVFTREA